MQWQMKFENPTSQITCVKCTELLGWAVSDNVTSPTTAEVAAGQSLWW